MRILDLLVSLSACLGEQIRADGGAEPCWLGVMPGDAVLADYVLNCDDGGIAWTRMASAYPTATVGSINTDLRNANTSMGYDIEIGILRPVQIGQDAPTVEESLAMAEMNLRDVKTIACAVSRCLDDRYDVDYILGQARPTGPLGGILGVTYELFVGL